MAYAYDNVDFSHYYDKFVADLPQHAFWIDMVQKIYSAIIQRTFVDDRQTVVVDLGCGTGKDLSYYANYFRDRNIKLIGVDHSQAMLDRAEERLANQSIDLVYGSLTNFASRLGTKPVDCILLPAGTYHHLTTDEERQDFVNNIREVLRCETGLFAIYLMPDAFIHVEPRNNVSTEEKLKLIATENVQQSDNEWICKSTFEFDVPPKTEIAWHVRTCAKPKFLRLLRLNGFEAVLCCLDGKELVPFNENMMSSLDQRSTPTILVFRKITNTS
ncbi:unnamed protein product [Adineta ricciae]|uniref:Methyltransferase domain-containing protein n=1 Tax=Adineta ricciae TaxID=249248 RepID=A0A814BSQ1_ADIRI|nr:unnamed protein product [Adineta ricciae]CAF1179868.1 unnamed protein product [Adineta ricciae]